MMQKLMAIEITLDDLQTLIIDSVNTCLKHHSPQPAPAPKVAIDAERLLTKKQAAELIGVCCSTVDNHARAGNLTRRYVGKAVRFSRDEVLQLAQEKTPRKAGESLLNGKKRRA